MKTTKNEWNEGYEDIEIIDFDDIEDNAAAPASKSPKGSKDQKKDRPFSALRLYLTGIISGILIVTLVLLIFDFLNIHPFSRTKAADAIYDLTGVMEGYIDKYYWKSDTSDEDFAAMAARGMVAALGDPYSAYFTNDEMTTVKERNDGDYAGIGISIGYDENIKSNVITNVSPDSPGAKAGLEPGDIIVEIDGTDVTASTTDDIVAMVRGKAGIEHTIGVLREMHAASGSAVSGSIVASEAGITIVTGPSAVTGASDDVSYRKLYLTVVTDNIINKSIYYQMLKDNIGYIHITNFDRETPNQFREAITELEKQEVKAIIFDVRNNGGGVLSAVLSVLDRILPEGTVLTETFKDKKNTVYRSTDDETLNLPLCVLMNSHSASAAEVFSGVLKDRLDIQLIGENSYGKGVVQSVYRLPNDMGGIKLTTGEYLLPSGESINGKGLAPDIAVTSPEDKAEYGTNSDEPLIRALETMQRATR
ncbi:MAG: S41 family peptidase [Eubacterium sp.]|nr:S41 family peptidase [Eubacterium sp.]